MTTEQEEAVRSYIELVEFAIRKAKDTPVGEVFACGCMGPMPECRCMKRQRLVREFLDAKPSQEVSQ